MKKGLMRSLTKAGKGQSKIILAIVLILVGSIGVYILGTGRAAGPFVSSESENGTLAGGAARIDDTTASGGKAVRFTVPVSQKLAYAPPKLTDPITIKVTNAKSSLKLDSAKDYILLLPGAPGNDLQSTPLQVKNGFRTTGGRNVVVKGGEIAHNVDYMGDAQAGDDAAKIQRSWYILDWTGDYFIEGVEFTGNHIYEVFNVSSGSDLETARIFVQNVRVSGPIKAILWKDSASASGTHHDGGDFFQNWGGPRGGVYIDKITVAQTTYQGFFHQPAQFGQLVPLETKLSRINIGYYKGNEAYPSWASTFYPALARTTFQPQAYMFWQSQRHNIAIEDFWMNIAPGKSLGKSVWPDTGGDEHAVTIKTDSTGQYAVWENPATMIAGKIRKGVPPSGDYVQQGTVGIGYVSPGYK